MAKLDFPVPTIVGEIWTQNDKSWRWTGVSWESAGDGGDTIVATSSADWNSAYTTVQSASGDWTVKDLGTFSNDSGAEAAMTYDGFYTWCRTMDGEDACSMLSCKRDTVIFHVSQLSHGETFIVGGEPGDHFTNVSTAIKYVQYLKLQARGVIYIDIRPGEYTFNSGLDLSHTNGDNIFIRPLAGSPSVVYPTRSDFTGVQVDDLNMLKGKYGVHFKFTNTSNYALLVSFGSARLQNILCYHDNPNTVSRALSVSYGAHTFIDGCSFTGFSGGILSQHNAYLNIKYSSISYMSGLEEGDGFGIKNSINSQLWGRGNIIYKCDSSGMTCSDSTARFVESVFVDCGNAPVGSSRVEAIYIADNSTFISPRAGTLSGNFIENCAAGLLVAAGSWGRLTDLVSINNDIYNVRAISGSRLLLGDPVALSGSGAGQFDVDALMNSTVQITSDANNIEGGGVTTYSIPLDTYDSNGSLIHFDSNPIQSIDNWDSTYTTVSANSASWIGSGDFTPATYAGEESVTLPNGMIMKHGLLSVIFGSATETFGTAFPTAILNVQLTMIEGNSTDRAPIKLGARSTTSFTALNPNGATLDVYWQAWGY